jgi:hypothetical protein
MLHKIIAHFLGKSHVLERKQGLNKSTLSHEIIGIQTCTHEIMHSHDNTHASTHTQENKCSCITSTMLSIGFYFTQNKALK